MVAPVEHATIRISMTSFEKTKAVVTDSHFLIPLVVFGIGLTLLITLH